MRLLIISSGELGPTFKAPPIYFDARFQSAVPWSRWVSSVHIFLIVGGSSTEGTTYSISSRIPFRVLTNIYIYIYCCLFVVFA